MHNHLPLESYLLWLEMPGMYGKPFALKIVDSIKGVCATKLVMDNLCSCKVLKQMDTYIVIYIVMTTGPTRTILDTVINSFVP